MAETCAASRPSRMEEKGRRMKPFYVVLLMGAAALGGGLVVRYTDHPVEITLAHSVPPTVVAPPIPPRARIGPSNSVTVRSAPEASKEPLPRPVAEKPAKPSAFSPVERVQPDAVVTEPRIVARVKIPPEPPAVTPLERSTVASFVATPAPAAAAPPAPAPAPVPPPPPESNHATLRAGMLINIRITEALSSNLNSPGDVFSGTLDRPLIADGFVIAERGARVRGEVVDSKSAAPGQGLPELSIRLREILASDGQRVHLVSEPWRKLGTPPTGNDRTSGRRSHPN